MIVDGIVDYFGSRLSRRWVPGCAVFQPERERVDIVVLPTCWIDDLDYSLQEPL